MSGYNKGDVSPTQPMSKEELATYERDRRQLIEDLKTPVQRNAKEIVMAFPIDDLAMKQGFNNAHDLCYWLNMVRLRNHKEVMRFQQWQEQDGTKQGLLKIISEQI